MNQISTVILLFCLSLFDHVSAQKTPCNEWKAFEENGSFHAYVRECADSPVHEFKINDQFTGNFESLLKVMRDVETNKRFSETCTESRILKRIDDNSVVQYLYFKMPIGIADRDIISKNVIYATATTLESTSEVCDENLVTLKNGVIRLRDARSHFYFEKQTDGSIRMEYTARANPNGAIPVWLVNVFARHEAKRVVEKLKLLIQN